MKLSEAMRLGAMLRPQARGMLESRRWFGIFGEKTTCALGAAIEAGGIGSRPGVTEGGESFRGRTKKAGQPANFVQFPYEWNVLLWQQVACPACERPIETAQRTIAHLNDHHRWSREQIADWIETLEPKAHQPVETTEAVTA